jgi:predicted negative regulator of RcsB-dependent stress response
MIRDARTTKAASDITRKDMKGPDHFQVAATGALEWAAARHKLLLGALGAVVAVAVVAVLVAQVMRSSRDKAGGRLYQALAAADGEISAVPLPGVDRPIYPSEEQRAKAILDATEKVRRESGGSRAALTATLAAGEAHLELKEWTPALSDFQAYLAGAPADDALRFAALDGLARAQEGKGDLPAAAAAFEQAGQQVAFVKDRATLEQARVLVRAGKVDEARKLLAAFPEQFKDSPLKSEAQERLARLPTGK